jgi:protein SCO1/2
VNRALAVAIVVLGLAAGVGAALVLTRDERGPPALERATWFQAPRPLPSFALVDQAGRPFGPERFRGHWTFLFFGFVNCPDVCPTTLATLAQARRTLGDMPAGRVPAVVFTSVDPGRDVPATLARYVRHFDASFTGVTGSKAAIESLTRALGVAVMFGAPDDNGNYTVDHSTGVFLVDPEARIAAMFGVPHEAAVLARDYRRIVAAAHGAQAGA